MTPTPSATEAPIANPLRRFVCRHLFDYTPPAIRMISTSTGAIASTTDASSTSDTGDASSSSGDGGLGQAAMDAFGGVHLVCNNAGVSAGGLSWEVPLADWRWVLEVNLWGVVHGVQTFVPLIAQSGGGHIVNTASMAGLTSPPFMSPYSVAKHGVVALSEALYHGAAGGMGDLVSQLIESGLDPAEVAEMVFQAVLGRRFWVFTGDEWIAMAADRARGAFAGENPQLKIPGVGDL